jgi:hypothetical protein
MKDYQNIYFQKLLLLIKELIMIDYGDFQIGIIGMQSIYLNLSIEEFIIL